MDRPRPRDDAPARSPGGLLMIGVAVVLLVGASAMAVMVFSRGERDTGASVTPPVSIGPSGSDMASPTTTEGLGVATTDPATISPSPTPSPFARPDDVLPPGSLVRVTADGLRLRSGHSTEFDVAAVVAAGEILYVESASWGPTSAEGYDWYGVSYAPGYTAWPLWPESDDAVTGSLAARSGSEWFVELVPPECPGTDAPSLDVVVTMTPYERVVCLGDARLTFEGTFGCPYCDGLASPIAYEPAWLASPGFGFDWLVPGWADYPRDPGSITVKTPPEITGPGRDHRGKILRVSGHFEDHRASECTVTPDPSHPSGAPKPEWVEWYCRQNFVLEAWEVIGTDPAFEAANPHN